jgi:hypothetical protein
MRRRVVSPARRRQRKFGAYSNITISVSDGSARVSLAAFSITVSDVGNGSTTLTNLSGYQVRYGRTASNLDQAVSLDNPSINRYVVENLSTGTWYFAVVAVNVSGVTSSLSNTSNKTIS